MRLARVLVAAASLAAFATVTAPVQCRTIELADLRRSVGISDPQISPDATRVAVVTSTGDYDKDEQRSVLQLVDVRSGGVRQLTYDRKGLGSPRWSPDGTRLAFLADFGSGSAAMEQVWVMRLDGGDAVAVTRANNGVDEFAWRPDGKAIAFVADDDAPNKAAVDNNLDAFQVGDSDFTARQAPASSQLWIVAADGGRAKKLTNISWQLSQLSWSPSGAAIAAAAQRSLYSGDGGDSSIVIVDAKTGARRWLTGRQPEYGPLYSPDGTSIAYGFAPGGTIAHEPWVYLHGANGASDRRVGAALDRDISPFQWTPDGKAILASGNDDETASLWAIRTDGSVIKAPLHGVAFYQGTMSRNGTLAFTGADERRPPEVYVLGPGAGSPRRLTDFNRYLAQFDVAPARAVTWTNDGFKEDGVLVMPPHADPHRRYPLVLLIHGGPTSASSVDYSALVQVFAAQGWAVFEPNYRGSDNLGARYMEATIGDLGAGPGRDIVAGVREIERRGFVDPNRVAVGGWSEGGCLTSWLITHYDLWRAAVAGAAVTDWIAEYNLSDALDYERAIAGPGGPWVDGGWAKYAAESSIGAASKVKAPTLILSDTGDYRVPTPEEYAFYHALKDNGATVRYIAFPAHAHFPGDPVQREAIYRLWLDWFETYLH